MTADAHRAEVIATIEMVRSEVDLIEEALQDLDASAKNWPWMTDSMRGLRNSAYVAVKIAMERES